MHIEIFVEDNRECTLLFSERFSTKQYMHKNLEEDNREYIYLFSERVPIKKYISKIFKIITENIFTCFPKDSLSNNAYLKF